MQPLETKNHATSQDKSKSQNLLTKKNHVTSRGQKNHATSRDKNK